MVTDDPETPGSGKWELNVASTLQQANFIHYSRGHIEIVNRDGLTRTACECYTSVKAHYERLLRPQCVAEEAPRSRAGSSSW